MRIKTESLRQSESKRNRARVERGAEDVPKEPGSRADEQVAVRHADASGGDIRETQHEEDRMRDIQIGKRGSEAAGEVQLDKLRKTVRFEQEAPSAAASSDQIVALEYPSIEFREFIRTFRKNKISLALLMLRFVCSFIANQSVGHSGKASRAVFVRVQHGFTEFTEGRHPALAKEKRNGTRPERQRP